MPHCTTDFAWYLGKFIVGFTGMLFIYVGFLRENEYTCICKLRMREMITDNDKNTNSRELGDQKDAGANQECEQDCTRAVARSQRDWYKTITAWLWHRMADWTTSGSREVLQTGRDHSKNDNAAKSSSRDCISRTFAIRKCKCPNTCLKKKWSTRRCSRRVCIGTTCSEELRKRKTKRPCLRVRPSVESIGDSWQLSNKNENTTLKKEQTSGMEETLDVKPTKSMDSSEFQTAGLAEGPVLKKEYVEHETASDEEVIANDFIAKREIKSEELEVESTIENKVDDKSTQKNISTDEGILTEDVVNKALSSSHAVHVRCSNEQCCSKCNSYTCKSKYAWIYKNDELPVTEDPNDTVLYHELKEESFFPLCESTSSRVKYSSRCPKKSSLKSALKHGKCVRMCLTSDIQDETVKRLLESRQTSSEEIQDASEDEYCRMPMLQEKFGRRIDIDTYQKQVLPNARKPSSFFYSNCCSLNGGKRVPSSKCNVQTSLLEKSNYYQSENAESTSSVDSAVDYKAGVENRDYHFRTKRFEEQPDYSSAYKNYTKQCRCRHYKATITTDNSGRRKTHRSWSSLSSSGRCFRYGQCTGPCRRVFRNLHREPNFGASCLNGCSTSIVVEKPRRRYPRPAKKTALFSSASSTSSFSSTNCKSQKSDRTTCSSD